MANIGIAADEHWPLLKKYANRPISFADACLIRCAEIHQEPRIAPFDSDFNIYRWAQNKKFLAL